MADPIPPRSADHDAFANDFAAAGPALLAWARLRVRPELRALLDPEDLVQEVGCRALTNLASFDPARASFRQWLFGIANRVLLEALRELGRHPVRRSAPVADGSNTGGFSDVAAAVTTITRKVARDELIARFLVQVDALEDGDRALLLHHGLEELPHGQVAGLLGIGEDTVRKRWQRLRDRLRGDPAFAVLAIGA